jgi:hypothetical protein
MAFSCYNNIYFLFVLAYFGMSHIYTSLVYHFLVAHLLMVDLVAHPVGVVLHSDLLQCAPPFPHSPGQQRLQVVS